MLQIPSLVIKVDCQISPVICIFFGSIPWTVLQKLAPRNFWGRTPISGTKTVSFSPINGPIGTRSTLVLFICESPLPRVVILLLSVDINPPLMDRKLISSRTRWGIYGMQSRRNLFTQSFVLCCSPSERSLSFFSDWRLNWIFTKYCAGWLPECTYWNHLCIIGKTERVNMQQWLVEVGFLYLSLPVGKWVCLKSLSLCSKTIYNVN